MSELSRIQRASLRDVRRNQESAHAQSGILECARPDAVSVDLDEKLTIPSSTSGTPSSAHTTARRHDHPETADQEKDYGISALRFLANGAAASERGSAEDRLECPRETTSFRRGRQPETLLDKPGNRQVTPWNEVRFCYRTKRSTPRADVSTSAPSDSETVLSPASSFV